MQQTSIAKKYFFTTLAISFAYAFIRYFIFKEVPYTKIPLWITNKALSLCATILIIRSFTWKRGMPRKEIGLLGGLMAIIHSIISAAMLNPAYYGKFFQTDNILTFNGEMCFLFGAIGLTCLMIAGYYSFPSFSNNQQVNLKEIKKNVGITLICTLIHLYFMGAAGWLDFSHWPGYMPPISLVAFGVIIIGLIFKFLKKPHTS